MTLGRALGHLDDESDYTVDVHDRLRELLLPGDEDLGADVELTYSWSGGYERLTYHRAGGGSSEYRAAPSIRTSSAKPGLTATRESASAAEGH